MQIASHTCLTLVVSLGPNVTHYTAYAVGQSRWGICTTLPQILQKAYTLPPGTRLVVQYVAGRVPVEFETYVLGYQETVPPTMVLAEPKEIQRRERRESLRLAIRTPMHYVTSGARVTGERTETVDLSMGGLCMLTELNLPVSTPLKVFLELPSATISLDGRLAWNGYRGRQHMAGIEFRQHDATAQRMLAIFLFAMERQMGQQNQRPEEARGRT